MAQIKKANTICRNCKKKYYSCYHCLKTQNWRSICCSQECYDKYAMEILKTRGVAIAPQRLDMTEDDVKKFISETSENEAIEKTKEDLSEYINENPDMSITEIVEKVNEDIDNSDKKPKRKRKINDK